MAASDIDFTKNLDAVFKKGDYFYFFKSDEYMKYNYKTDVLSSSSPRKISSGFKGVFPDNIDAAFKKGNYVYFFKNDEYTRFDWEDNGVSKGYPRKISAGFNGVYTEGIDAAINKDNDDIYFFRGGEYVKYNWKDDKSSKSSSIQEGWNGVNWDRIDSGVCIGSNGLFSNDRQYYFFKGEEYLRYDSDTSGVPKGYPSNTGQYWNLISGFNWMNKIEDATYLSQMSLPGTHDSGANRVIPYSQCQNLSISDQLKGGIRYIDVRCHVNRADFSIYHGKIPQFKTFDSVLDGIRTFLEENPSESVIMNLQDEEGDVDSFRNIFDDEYRDYEGITWYGLHDQVDAKDFKSLQLKDIRGKVLVIDNSPKGENGLQGKYRRHEVFLRGKNMTPKDDDGKNLDEKWAFVESDLNEAQMKNGEYGIYLNSCAGVRPPYLTPADYAEGGVLPGKGINDRIASYLKKNPFGAYGIMSLDYAFSTDGLVSKLIYANKRHFK